VFAPVVPEKDHTSVAKRWRRRLLVVACVPAVLSILLAWAAMRRTAEDKEIDRLLAGLRAAGEPLNAEDLARLFPDPSPKQDGQLIYKNAMSFATNYPLPGGAPLILSPLPTGGKRIDERTMRSLLAFASATAAITNELPGSVPPNTRFPLRWSAGLTNFRTFNAVQERALTQLLITRAVTAAEVGNPDEASTMLAHGFRFAGCVNREGLFVEHMIGHACHDLLVNATEFVMTRLSLREDQLRRIAAAIVQERANDFENAARAERCLFIWAFSQARQGASEEEIYGMNPITFLEEAWGRLTRDHPFYRDEDFIAYLRLIPKEIEALRVPATLALPRAASIGSNYEAGAVSDLGISMSPSYIERVLSGHTEAIAHLDCLLAALVIEQYRTVNSNNIPGWSDMVPAYMAAPPNDLFGSTTLKLKKLPRGYAVYSVGPDGVDNGGIAKTNGAARSGYDITVTVDR
jgi:hypothetical protein